MSHRAAAAGGSFHPSSARGDTAERRRHDALFLRLANAANVFTQTQTDRATRLSVEITRTTVGTSCTTNPQQIEVIELEGYS